MTASPRHPVPVGQKPVGSGIDKVQGKELEYRGLCKACVVPLQF